MQSVPLGPIALHCFEKNPSPRKFLRKRESGVIYSSQGSMVGESQWMMLEKFAVGLPDSGRLHGIGDLHRAVYGVPCVRADLRCRYDMMSPELTKVYLQIFGEYEIKDEKGVQSKSLGTLSSKWLVVDTIRVKMRKSTVLGSQNRRHGPKR
jgi:hypothetical protein